MLFNIELLVPVRVEQDPTLLHSPGRDEHHDDHAENDKGYSKTAEIPLHLNTATTPETVRATRSVPRFIGPEPTRCAHR